MKLIDIAELGALVLLAVMLGLLAVEDYRMRKKTGISLIFPYFGFAAIVVMILEFFVPQLPPYSAMLIVLVGFLVVLVRSRKQLGRLLKAKFRVMNEESRA